MVEMSLVKKISLGVLAFLDFLLASVAIVSYARAGTTFSLAVIILLVLLWQLWMMAVVFLLVAMVVVGNDDPVEWNGPQYELDLFYIPYIVLNVLRLGYNIVMMVYLFVLLGVRCPTARLNFFLNAMRSFTGTAFDNALALSEVKATKCNVNSLIGWMILVLVLYSMFIVFLHCLAMSTVPTKKIAQITTGQKKEGKGGNADVKTTSGIDKKGKKQHMYDDPLLKNL